MVFEHIADQCASRLAHALFIVVSNPVELAVDILSFAVDRKRVMGMGAQHDSLRFARAIAADLAISGMMSGRLSWENTGKPCYRSGEALN